MSAVLTRGVAVVSLAAFVATATGTGAGADARSATRATAPSTARGAASLGRVVGSRAPMPSAHRGRAVFGFAPTVTAFSASHLSQGEMGAAAVAGGPFARGATVSLGTGITTRVLKLTATRITLRYSVAAGATYGTRGVTVRNPGGLSGTLAKGVHVDYGPVLTDWAVGDGATDWTTSLARPSFAVAPSISFTGSGVTVVSERVTARHQLIVRLSVTASAPPTWRAMTLIQGTTTWFAANGLKVRLAASVTSIAPLGQGASHQLVPMRGSRFEICPRAEPIVSLSGSGVTINSVNVQLDNFVLLTVTVSATATVGPRSVTVTNCYSKGKATFPGAFTVLPAPKVTSIPAIAVGVSRTETVTGSGFTPTTVLALSGLGVGISHVTYVSATHLLVNVTASPTALPGTRTITATNLDGSYSVAPGALVVQAQPTVASTAPAIAPGASQPETITGTGFLAGATVIIGAGGVQNPDLVLGALTVSSTQIQFMLTADPSLAPGTYDVTVSNLNGGSVTATGSLTVT